MKKAILMLVILATTFGVSMAKKPKDLIKEKEFPQYITFRGEQTRAYENWLKFIYADALIINRKYMTEEVDVDPITIDNTRRYFAENPDKMGLVHLNGEGRQVKDYPEDRDRFFPGHWVYAPGSTAKTEITASQTTVEVVNAKPFSRVRYIDRQKKPFEYYPPYAIIVPILNNGEKDWYNSEYCIVSQVDIKENKITLERGALSTAALDYAKGAYIAPLEGDVWANDVMWYYNLSSVCPVDKEGKNAADVFIDYIDEWFSMDDHREMFRGIAFDVNYFSQVPKNLRFDVDADGKPDAGWIGGKNVWAEGDYKFLVDLRKRMGDDFLITADAQHSTNQQALGVLNGMESEGLVQHNDAWRGFSRTVNTHTYWADYNPLQDFRYVVMKFMNAEDAAKPESMNRFVVAASSCLGAYVTQPRMKTIKESAQREFLPAGLREVGSFGKLDGELIHLAKATPTFDMGDILSKATGENCNVEITRNGVMISANPNTTDSVMVVKFEGLKLPAGESTFFISAVAVEPHAEFMGNKLIPRIVSFEASNAPQFKQKVENNLYNELYGLYAPGKERENSFYIRNTSATDDGSIELRIEGRGKFLITAIELHNATAAIARNFENVMIVVNPSTQEQTFNVNNQDITIPALDAYFIKK